MENETFDLTNPGNTQNTRTENSPGFSCVMGELENGVDLQPVEDITESPIIAFEDQSARLSSAAEEEETNPKQRRKRRWLMAFAGLLLIVAVLFGAYSMMLRWNDFSHAAVAVYKKGADVCVLLDNEQTVTLENVAQTQLSADGMRLVYAQDTAAQTGKFDLRLLELKKRTSVKSGGALIADGIDGEWRTDGDCSYVYYTQTKGKDTHHYAYAVAERETYSITYAAQDVFLPPRGNIVYFTRKGSDGIQLYRIRLGEKAEMIETVSAAKGFADETALEVFYTVSKGGSQYDLYKISGDKLPEKIAENISEVYLDDYTVGGNLYYFIKADSKLNWTDFVTDTYADSDAVMNKPDKGEYLVTRGFVLRRTTVDEAAYNQAMEKYNRKLLRDEIREALDKLDLGLAISAEYKVKVYDGEKSKELAGGVKLENVIDFSATGTPQMIFKKTAIDAAKKISMETLYQQAAAEGTAAAMDAVLQTLRGEYEVNNGYKYAWYNGTNVFEYDFAPNYAVEKASFLFAGRNTIFAAVKTGDTQSKLYYHAVNAQAITEQKQIADKVLSYEINGGRLYYITADRTLYVCSADGNSEKISDHCVQFFADAQSGQVVILSSAETEELLQTVDVLLYADGKLQETDTAVDYRYFVVNGAQFAYLKNYQTAAATETEIQSGGEMLLYNGKKIKSIDTNVTEIITFRTE